MSSMHIDFRNKELSPTVLRALRGLRFGSVEIVVHDGRVVQIERRERVRLDRRATVHRTAGTEQRPSDRPRPRGPRPGRRE